MSSWRGKRLSLELYGESHSKSIGIKACGLPKMHFDYDELLLFMRRRQGANLKGTTERKESDIPIFLSGVDSSYNITHSDVEIAIENTNVRSRDYSSLYAKPRPSHADYADYLKNGTLDFSGGGRFSARLTAPIVALGGILKQHLEEKGIRSYAYISQVGGIMATSYKTSSINEDALLENVGKFPSLSHQAEIEKAVLKAKSEGDSLGAKAECIVFGVKGGTGDDYFDALECKLASLLYAIPAVKAIEFGSGVDFANMKGSDANDPLYYDENGFVQFRSNKSGGINGGIANGSPITMTLTFRPTPSIALPQDTIDLENKCNTVISIYGRHDSCVSLRALPIIESFVSIALFDEIG